MFIIVKPTSADTIVLASRAFGCHLDTQTPKKSSLKTPKYFREQFLKMSIASIQLFFLGKIFPPQFNSYEIV